MIAAEQRVSFPASDKALEQFSCAQKLLCAAMEIGGLGAVELGR